jgi:hypothetical protein
MRKTKKDNDTTQSVCESEGGFIDMHAADLFALSRVASSEWCRSQSPQWRTEATARSYASQWLSVDVVKTFAVARGGRAQSVVRATMKPIRR